VSIGYIARLTKRTLYPLF